jgi:hypothetical protein
MFTSKILCLASFWYFVTQKSNVCSFLCLLHCCFLKTTTILKHPTQLLTYHYQIHIANFLQHWSNIFPQTTKMKTIAWSQAKQWSLRALKLPKSTIKHDFILNFNSFIWAPNTIIPLCQQETIHIWSIVILFWFEIIDNNKLWKTSKEKKKENLNYPNKVILWKNILRI